MNEDENKEYMAVGQEKQQKVQEQEVMVMDEEDDKKG